MVHDDNEELLLKQFKVGDEIAFKVVFDMYYGAVCGFCEQFLYDRDQSKNIAQEAFIHLWLKRSNISKFNGIKSFLYTYSKSACLKFIRHKKIEDRYVESKLQNQEEELNALVLQTLSFDAEEHKELESLIRKSIDDMPYKCRLVFEMKRLKGLKNTEIAQRLEISEKAVEANMTRALKHMKTRLAPYLPVFLLEMIFINTLY